MHVSISISISSNMADSRQIIVQELVKNPIHEIPQRYLVDLEPSNPDKASALPIIDLQAFLHRKTRVSELQNLHQACKEWGIFQVVNHGVDSSLVEKLKREIQEFYGMPLEERSKYGIRAGEFEGYGQTVFQNSGDHKSDWADRFFMITNPVSRRKPHLLPELPPSLRETLEAYISELQKMAMAMFGYIAEALEIEKREIEKMFGEGMQSVRMNYYPPCPEPEKVVGLTPHSDGSGLTVLLQVNGVEGFQIKKDGLWMPINFLPQALAVNLGDILEILSNGLYKSVEHRATVNSEKERISIAMFFNPTFEAQVGPWPALLIDDPPRFRTMKMDQFAAAFFSRKLNGKFLDCMKL